MKAEISHKNIYSPLMRCISSFKHPNNTQYMHIYIYMPLPKNVFLNLPKNRSQKLSMLEDILKTVLESALNSAHRELDFEFSGLHFFLHVKVPRKHIFGNTESAV